MNRTLSHSKFLVITVAILLITALIPFNSVSGQNQPIAKNNNNLAYASQSPYIGIWISAQELANLPMSGTAWNALKSAADSSASTPDIQNQDDNTDVKTLAKALVYARTGDANYRTQVITLLKQAKGTEAGGRTLALGRNLVSYVIAADLINLPAADPTFDAAFRTWLRQTLTETLDSKTLRSTHEERPNNWGTHAGASRAAVARYLGDKAELDRTALVFRGYTGDRTAYKSFAYGDLSYQCDSANPVGINPKGCVKSGHSIDGAIPDDMRRGGTFQYPPVFTGYPWEALQGAVVQAEILSRAGYSAWEWQDRAMLRAVNYLYSIGWKPEGDDAWQVWVINHAYGTTFAAASPAAGGKNMGWTDWTHSLKTASGPLPTQPPAPIATKAPTSVATIAPTTPPSTVPTQAPAAAPTATPVSSGSSTLIKTISFENGSLTDATTGFDRLTGSVALDGSNQVGGVYSAAFNSAGSIYLEENFNAVDQLYVSMLIRVRSLPSGGARVLQISNAGTTVGNLMLQSNGTLQIRVGSASISASSQPLQLNTVYRVALRQVRGSGSNAILEGYLAPAGQAFAAPFAATNTGAWINAADRIRVGATASVVVNALIDDISLDSGKMP